MDEFADEVTREVVGVSRVLSRFHVRSAFASSLAQNPPWFGPDDHEAWRAERSWLEAVDDWFTSDHQAGVAAALDQLPNLERVFLVLESGESLADVGLFEVKRFAFWAADLVDIAAPVLPENSWSRELRELMAAIHPERQPSARFALSPELDSALAAARAEVKRLRQVERSKRTTVEAAIAAELGGTFDIEGRFVADTTGRIDDERLEFIRDRHYRVVAPELVSAANALEDAKSKCTAAEATVRRSLSNLLRPLLSMLAEVREALARLDFGIARVELRRRWDGCWPRWEQMTSITDGLHPVLLDETRAQRVSFTLAESGAVITGPNMGGKSMLLKLLGLFQWCAQHGFPVPAADFCCPAVARLVYVGADAPEVSAHAGLSAFGREVKRVVRQGHADGSILWLLDEFARGTHPAEGAALAHDFVAKRLRAGDRVVAATHFPSLALADFAAQFQIAGLKRDVARAAVDQGMDADALEAALRGAMDYQPVPRSPNENDVPRDARLVATLLGLELDD